MAENLLNHIAHLPPFGVNIADAEKYYGSLHFAFSTSNDKYAEVRMRKS